MKQDSLRQRGVSRFADDASAGSGYDQPMRIGVAGINGRMGRLVPQAVPLAGAVLSAGLAHGSRPDQPGIWVASMTELAQASDVVIDFTHADAALGHACVLREHAAAWVLGTTGLGAQAEAAVRAAARNIPVVWAANFSPGVTLVLAAAAMLARALPGAEYDAEILEMHHRGKRDAPSGTALALAQAVAAGRGTALQAIHARHGQTGVRPPGGVGFAALRGGQVVGEHTLLFAGDAEHISLTHKALDRRVFANGAVRAALWVWGRPPGLYGMADVLGLPSAGQALE